MNKNLLFATELYSFNNENIDNDKIKEIILEKEKNEPSKKLSNKGGWQSQEDLIKEKDFSEIKDFLFECTESITKDLLLDNVKFFMLQGWANVNRKGDYNIPHIHPNSHWSCAYYITETYLAPIYFFDPRIRAEMFSAVDSKTIGLEKSVPGQALFFPAWLQHAVHHNLTDNPRISISCNFVLIEG